MAKLPINRMKKSEIAWLNDNMCRHGHTYLSHYSCFLEEKPDGPLDIHSGYLDIETSNLAANYGIVYCYCIKDEQSDKIYERTITARELKSSTLDKEVIRQCIKDLENFDRVVTYYGTKFDIPFLRTRAVHHGLQFPEYGELIHTDVYYMVRNKFRLNSNRLNVACECLLGHTDKTRINSDYWIRAMGGDKEALDYITEHCRYDVLDLEKLHNVVIPFRKRLDTSA